MISWQIQAKAHYPTVPQPRRCHNWDLCLAWLGCESCLLVWNFSFHLFEELAAQGCLHCKVDWWIRCGGGLRQLDSWSTSEKCQQFWPIMAISMASSTQLEQIINKQIDKYVSDILTDVFQWLKWKNLRYCVLNAIKVNCRIQENFYINAKEVLKPKIVFFWKIISLDISIKFIIFWIGENNNLELHFFKNINNIIGC